MYSFIRPLTFCCVTLIINFLSFEAVSAVFAVCAGAGDGGCMGTITLYGKSEDSVFCKSCFSAVKPFFVSSSYKESENRAISLFVIAALSV